MGFKKLTTIEIAVFVHQLFISTESWSYINNNRYTFLKQLLIRFNLLSKGLVIRFDPQEFITSKDLNEMKNLCNNHFLTNQVIYSGLLLVKANSRQL